MNLWFSLVAGIASIALAVLEWRRPSRRHRLARIGATICAVAALAELAAPPESPRQTDAGITSATLWTAGANPALVPPSNLPQIALLDAARGLPAGIPVVPDAGTLRRRFPRLRSLRLIGDGMEPEELPTLAGLEIEFLPAPAPSRPHPGIIFLYCPRVLPLGQTFTLSGRLAGLPSGGKFSLNLEAPDGSHLEAQSDPADERGEAGFHLPAPAMPAVGRYLWRLQAGETDQPLGISVVSPLQPKVLVLASAPQFDTSALLRWYTANGGEMTVRTKIGKDLFHDAATSDDLTPVKTLADARLDDYALVVADRQAIAELSGEEQTRLLRAVETKGLGLLALADDSMASAQSAAPSPTLDALLPWKLVSTAAATASNEEQTARLHWRGQSVGAANPVPVIPRRFELQPGQQPLIDDGQGHALAASAQQGRGQIAQTLIRDTSRLLRQNDPAAFAAYWSFLFSKLARPLDPAAPRAERWTLVNGDAGPLFVNHPLELRWTRPAGAQPLPLPAITVRSGKGETSLAPVQSRLEPNVFSTTFWPREPGWHRVGTTPAAATLDFYVHPADAWPELQAERRRQATVRFAADARGTGDSISTLRVAGPHSVASVWWFLLLVAAAGYLWIERRFASLIG